MFSRLKESTIYALKAVATFFRFFWFGFVVLSGWVRSFAFIDKWVYVFLVPKILIVILWLLVTDIPLWILIPTSFLPVGIARPAFFIAFIFALAQ